MKKFLLTIALTVFVFGIVTAQQGLTLSGEMRTGLFWYSLQRELTRGGDWGTPDSTAFISNSQGIGEGFSPIGVRQPQGDLIPTLSNNQARLRLDFHYNAGLLGTMFRFETTYWPMAAIDQRNSPFWVYAFVYGNFFNDNLRISAGLLGNSPWGMSAFEPLWNDLDSSMGMRFEFIPQNIPFIVPGSLNIGFVLNNFDRPLGRRVDESGSLTTDRIPTTITDVLLESVLGIAYTHDLFHVRFVYRLDSEVDGIVEQFPWSPHGRPLAQGDSVMFRIEERVLSNFLPGFQVWINGFHSGLRSNITEIAQSTNFLYLHYDQGLFVGQIRLGYLTDLDLTRDVGGRIIRETRHSFSVQPSFFFRLFDDFLFVGSTFGFTTGIGNVRWWDNAPYQHWFIEPEVRVNLSPNAQLSLVYRYYSDFEYIARELNTVTHWINLRVLFSF
ncbi:MAG: hypothetical protein FWC97_01245 [Treponema sp.]|nr:hypothetical protein [Treponema sp.]